MPPKCSVCAHPKRREIDRLIADPKASLRNIAAQFDTSASALSRHKACIGKAINKLKVAKKTVAEEVEVIEADAFLDAAKDQARKEAAVIVSVEQVINKLFDGIMKLWDACERDLRDPDDPDAFSLRPRASEIRLDWDERTIADGQTVWTKRHGSLQELLDRSALCTRCKGESGYQASRSETAPTHKDRAELLLKTASELSKNAEFLAKLEGRFRPVEKELGDGNTVQLVVIQQLLIQAGILPPR